MEDEEKLKKNISNILIIFIAICLIIPFLTTVFYIRTAFWIIVIFVHACCLGGIILSYVIYYFNDTRKNIKRNLLIIIGVVIVAFFLSYGYQLDAADYIFFKLREKKFNEFVAEIKNYGKIKEMSDGNRYTKTLNEKRYEFREKDISPYDKKFTDLYSDLLKTLEIDENVHQDFRNKLSDVDCIEFQCFDDGAVCFTIDGWLNRCNGVTYSTNGTEHVIYGKARIWKHIEGDWYAWAN